MDDIRIVYSEAQDYVNLYADGKLVVSGHNLMRPRDVLSALGISYRLQTVPDDRFDDLGTTTEQLDEVIEDIENCKIEW